MLEDDFITNCKEGVWYTWIYGVCRVCIFSGIAIGLKRLPDKRGDGGKTLSQHWEDSMVTIEEHSQKLKNLTTTRKNPRRTSRVTQL